jgi:integrase
VFASPIGTPLDASAVTHRFHRQLAAAGLPRQRFHDLRHACASYLLASNVPMKVVQEILGHSQLSTTADIYSHVAPSSSSGRGSHPRGRRQTRLEWMKSSGQSASRR